MRSKNRIVLFIVIFLTFLISYLIHKTSDPLNIASNLYFKGIPPSVLGVQESYILNNCSESFINSSSLSEKDKLTQIIRNCYLTQPTGVNPDIKTLDAGIHNDFIVKTFSGLTGGFFVNAGTEEKGNTSFLWLEQNLNWTGLLIERDPLNCRKLLREKRNLWFSCSCISASDEAQVDYITLALNEEEISENSATTQSPNSIHKFFTDIFKVGQDTFMEKMQCFPLASYLYAVNATNVDLLSVHTGGSEEKILATFPFKDITVRYMILEVLNINYSIPVQTDDDALVQLVTGMGFVYLDRSEGAYYFRNTNEKD